MGADTREGKEEGDVGRQTVFIRIESMVVVEDSRGSGIDGFQGSS